jgi:quercetin dioxygenase-like cupin family protein
MMLRNLDKGKQQKVANAHGGEGFIYWYRAFDESDFNSKWEFVDWVSIPPNCSVGIHKHDGNEEMYFVVNGTGLMTVDGEERIVTRGDVVLTKSGSSHGLKNNSNEDIDLFVVEVKR